MRNLTVTIKNMTDDVPLDKVTEIFAYLAKEGWVTEAEVVEVDFMPKRKGGRK